jgi:hypothetical protein
LQEFRSSGVQEFRSSGVQEFRQWATAKSAPQVKVLLDSSPKADRSPILQLLNSCNS